MKKGFTLIELLAVIVILAIISAIAIPIVIKVINDVKVNSLKISMSNIEKAVELYINRNPMSENKVFTCSNGVCIDELNKKLELSGNIIESGSINITPSGTITYNKLILDGYLCDKYNKEFVCNKVSKNIEETKEESIIIENSSTSLNNYKIYGNSIQNSKPTNYTPIDIKNLGEKTKNLLSYPYFDTTKTVNGITFTDNGDGTITANGTATGVASFIINRNNLALTNTSYIFYNVPNGVTIQLQYKKTNGDYGWISNGYGTFTWDMQNTFYQLYIQISSGTVLNNVVIKPQLELGNISTEYELYNKYKIPIKSNGKNLLNENLYKKTDTVNGITTKYEGNGTFHIYGEYVNSSSGPVNIPLQNVNMPVVLDPNEYYTYSAILLEGSTTHNVVPYIGFKSNTVSHKNGFGMYIKPSTTIGTKVKETNKPSVYLENANSISRLWFYTNVPANETFTVDCRIQIWLEKGKESTAYEPYKEIKANIYLDEPLRKLGSYVDYIDYKNQKEIRNVGVLNLNSEDNLELIDNYFVLSLESYPKKDEELSISNYLEYGKSFIFEGNKLKIKIEGINTIEELKTWLRDNNVEIYYPLSKSVVRDIELPEIKLNKNYSIITVDTDIKPSNMLIEYD